MELITINNSKNSAIKSGGWSNPGASFYNRLLECFYCKGNIPTDAQELDKKIKSKEYLQWYDFLKEAYLVAPISKIQNSPYGKTPYTRSGCGYPHHVFKGKELVVSIPGLKAAYKRACQMGVMKGDVQEHLERHIKELGIQASFQNNRLTWNEEVEFIEEETNLELKLGDNGVAYYAPSDNLMSRLEELKLKEKNLHDEINIIKSSYEFKINNKEFKELYHQKFNELKKIESEIKELENENNVSVEAVIESNFRDIYLYLMENSGIDLYQESFMSDYVANPANTSDETLFAKKIWEEIGDHTPEALHKWVCNNISYLKDTKGWKLKTPKDTYESKSGICHDQALFNVFMLHMLTPVTGRIFFVECKDDIDHRDGNGHTLAYYGLDPTGNLEWDYYWFETAWDNHIGIHGPYDSVHDLKDAIVEAYKKDDDINSNNPEFNILGLGDVSNHHKNMNMNQYVKSWELHPISLTDDEKKNEVADVSQINEYANLIDLIANNGFDNELLLESTEVLAKGKKVTRRQLLDTFLSSITTPEELNKYMDCIEYGFMSKKDGRIDSKHKKFDDEKYFYKEYYLQSPGELLESKLGVCWDQTELERAWFNEKGINNTIIYIEILDNKDIPSHTFLVYETEKDFRWFEHSWDAFKGIHTFTKLRDLISTVITNHQKFNNDTTSPVNIRLLSKAPSFHISCDEFMEYARKQLSIDLVDVGNEIFNESAPDPRYDPPLPFDQLPDHLKEDEVHAWRAKHGIELIHKEPTLGELERIWKNWNLMSKAQKIISNNESIRLFGMDNREHYWKLVLTEYPHKKVAPEKRGINRAHIKEYTESESHEMDFDKLYFGSQTELDSKTISVKSPRGLILFQTIRAASLNGLNKDGIAKEYFESILAKNNKEIFKPKYTVIYGPITSSGDNEKPLTKVQLYHDVPSYTEVGSGSTTVYIYEVDIDKIKYELSLIEDGWLYKGTTKLPIRQVGSTELQWSITYSSKIGTTGSIEIKDIKESIIYECGIHEGQGIDGDDMGWLEQYLLEEGETFYVPYTEKADNTKTEKNGNNRKELYNAFIEWCKEFNNKNIFGNIFDKDAFTNTYPFIPNELRYFYRLANPLLCVLDGDLTFFQASEIKEINEDNTDIDKFIIFAATPNDFRVFNIEDKKVYKGIEEDNKIILKDVLADSFDLYIQNMINKGDFLSK